MKRELKFRAWDTKNNEWFKTVLKFFGFSLFGECTLICPPEIERLKDMEITQFTGLKDEKGNDIYEGDILKLTCDYKIRMAYMDEIKQDNSFSIIEVAFINGCFQFRTIKQNNYYYGSLPSEYKPLFTSNKDYIIIGNIYENKELLNETK